MPVLRARIAGAWVDITSPPPVIPDEVFIGPSTPADAATELWYDTDEPNLADPDTARWNSAWGVIAVGTLTIGDGQQWTNQAAVTNPLTVNGMSSARRYKVYLRIRALAAGVNFTYNMVLKVDGAYTAISSERHGQVIGSAGDSYTQVHADWLITQVQPLSNGSHTFQVIYSGPTGATGYGIGGEFYIEDVGPVSLASSPPAQPASVWTSLVPLLVNGWTAYASPYGPPGYRLVGDEVQLRGLVQSGGSGAAIATLPVGYRPPLQLIFPAQVFGGVVELRVDQGGVISPQTPVAGTNPSAWTSLSGVRYSVSA